MTQTRKKWFDGMRDVETGLFPECVVLPRTKHPAGHGQHELSAQLLTGVDAAFMVFFRWW